MLWLIVVISAYFLFATVALVDKHLLGEKIPNPKVYTFYVGTLGILSLFLIPLGLSIPEPKILFLNLFTGALFIFALFCYYNALKDFEASRIVPAIGGILPLFSFILIFFLFAQKETLSFPDFIAFLILVLGSVIISLGRGKLIDFKSLWAAILVAFLFALSFVLTKFAYNLQSFWSAFIWMRIGGFLFAFFFLLTSEVKEELFRKKATFQKKTAAIFLSNQALGASGFVLQNWAIALASFIYLPIINALQGIQYVFVLIFAILFSFKFPKILKEEISRKILLQKVLAILLISGGLIMLAFK